MAEAVGFLPRHDGLHGLQGLPGGLPPVERIAGRQRATPDNTEGMREPRRCFRSPPDTGLVALPPLRLLVANVATLYLDMAAAERGHTSHF